MRVELITINGIEYEFNLDTMNIKVFDRNNVKEVHKYLVQKPEDKELFKLPEKYDKIYRRLEKIEKDKKDKPKKKPKEEKVKKPKKKRKKDKKDKKDKPKKRKD